MFYGKIGLPTTLCVKKTPFHTVNDDFVFQTLSFIIATKQLILNYNSVLKHRVTSRSVHVAHC